MHGFFKGVADLFGLLTLSWFFKAFMTLQFNVLLGPSVQQFWAHAKHYAAPDNKHEAKSPLKCKDCEPILMSQPD